MRVWDEGSWESEFWDEFLIEFGPAAYVKARYEDGSPRDDVCYAYNSVESWLAGMDEPDYSGCACGDRDCYVCNTG